MAALQKIRNKAGLLIGVIGVALLAFILSDLFTSSNAFFNKFKDKVVSIDGEVVSTGEFQKNLEEYEHFLKFIYGESGSNNTVRNRDVVYRNLVEEKMINIEAEKLGLAVTEQEIADLVYGERPSSLFFYDEEIAPIFSDPQTRQFNREALNQFLSMVNMGNQSTGSIEQDNYIASARAAWLYIQKKIKTNRLKEKYTALVSGSYLTTDADAKQAYEDSKSIANFIYTVQPYSSLPDSAVTVSNDEVKKLYDKRKNNFKVDSEFRRISYFVKDVIPSDADYNEVETLMETAATKLAEADKASVAMVVNEYSNNPYSDFFIPKKNIPEGSEVRKFVNTASVGDMYGPVRENQSYVAYKLIDTEVAPDSVYMHTLPLPTGIDPSVVAALSDSLLNVIKGGKDFTKVAQEVWPGANIEENKVSEIELVQIGIRDACFSAKVGEPFKLNVNGQTMLVRVNKKSAPVEKVKLASIIMQVAVSDKTLNSIDNELNQFISENGKLENFDKAATEKGYSLRKDVLLAPGSLDIEPTAPNSNNIGSTRNIVNWAFNNKVGSVNKFDYTDRKIVAVMTEKVEGDYRPISDPEVFNMLKAELVIDKKAEKMITDLKAKNLTSVEAYAQEVGGKVDSLNFVSFRTMSLPIGFEPIFNAYAKDGEVNKLAAPMKGKNGVYAFSITSRETDPSEFNAESLKAQVGQQAAYQLNYSAMYILSTKMNVQDNRPAFW